MKKTSMILAFILLVTLAFSGAAFAATNGPHGSYVADTTACGQCHNTHASAGAGLSAFTLAGTDNSTYEACTYCHKASGASKYDTVNGAIFNTVDSKFYAAAGGGVDKMLTTEAVLTLTGNTTATTSTHEVKAIAGTLVAPGGNANTFAGMSCNTCHSAHGTTNSRQLLGTVNGVAGLTPTIAVAAPLANEVVTYTSGVDAFCSACHTDFNALAATSGDTANGVNSSKKRHRVGMGLGALTSTLPLQGTNVSCMTCHFAHGTSAANTVTFDRSATYNGTATSTSSTLLRLPNRGVCQECHKK